MASNSLNPTLPKYEPEQPSSSSSSSVEQQICLSYDEAIKELPNCLQSEDEQEQNELAMFLSVVDQLHKPVAGKLNSRTVWNYLQHLLKPTTHSNKEETFQAAFPEQLQQLTGSIAIEITSNVINQVDLYSTTISVLNVLHEFSWETKAALMITTFALTFGDHGLNLCEASKVSADEIQLFAKPKRGSKHHSEENYNLFTTIIELIGSITEFENLPTAYMSSKDPKVKVQRTHLIVTIYWIIRIIATAATSHILKISDRGYEFDKIISKLWEMQSWWSKNLEEYRSHLEVTLRHFQDLLMQDVDIEKYEYIKKFVQQENHDDSMEVLKILISSANDDEPPLYDCLNKRKVPFNVLEEDLVFLFISGFENIAPQVDDSKLNEFIDSFDQERRNQIECKIVWIPMVDRSLARIDVTIMSKLKPFLDWYYIVHYKNLLQDAENEKSFKGCYSICDPSMITNEVKKFIRDDWKYKGEPMVVVLDSRGNVVHRNAIHMFYCYGFTAFPFTNEEEKELNFRSYYWRDIIVPILSSGLGRQSYENMMNIDDEYILWYGGGDMEWIRSVTGMVPGIARELGLKINMVHVGEMMMMSLDDEEVVGSVKEEKLCSHQCISDPILLFLFWNRLHSYIYSSVNAGDATGLWVQEAQRWLNYDKSNVGWAILESRYATTYTKHGKVVLSTLKEFNMWKEDVKNKGFWTAFDKYSEKVHKRIFGEYYSIEFPSAALIKDQPPIHPECEECGRKMKEYTTLVCYHGRGRGRGGTTTTKSSSPT